jgi:hypothetical protein
MTVAIMTSIIGIITNRTWNEDTARWAFTLEDGNGAISCLTAEFCDGEPPQGKQVTIEGDYFLGNHLFEVYRIELA